MHYDAPYTLIQDNLLDFSHLSYVHATTIGTPSNATTRANVESIEGGLKVTRWYLNDQIQANRRSIVTFTGDADRWKIYEWHAPSFLHLYTGSAPAGTVLRARTILAEMIAAETRSAEASDAYSGDGDAASVAAVGSVVASAARRA